VQIPTSPFLEMMNKSWQLSPLNRQMMLIKLLTTHYCSVSNNCCHNIFISQRRMIFLLLLLLQGICHSWAAPVQNLTSELHEFIWTFDRTPRTGDLPDARPLLAQDNTTQKDVDTHPHTKHDMNPRFLCSSGLRQYMP